MSRPTFAERHPYWFVALIELTVLVVYIAAGTVEAIWHLGMNSILAIAQAALVVVLAIIVTRMRWWGRVGFRRAPAAVLLLAAPMLLPAFTNLYPGPAWPGLVEAAGFLLLALSVGFVEEVTYRGLMLQALAPGGQWRAIIVTTVLFSVSHMMNMLSGEDLWQAVMQLGYTAAIGFAFAALVLRTGTIWPLMIVHGLIDFVVFLADPALTASPVVDTVVNTTITVMFFAYGAWVLRRPAAAPSVETAEPQAELAPAGH